MDNYSTHKHEQVKTREAPPLPLSLHSSSSWLNLVERWFRELTQKRIRRGVFRSVPELEAAIHVEASNQATLSGHPARKSARLVLRRSKTDHLVRKSQM